MAKFCGKCGSALNEEFGLCPACDAEELARRQTRPKFCTKCGNAMDPVTGICPVCAPVTEQPVEPPVILAEEQTVESPVILAEEQPVEPEVAEVPAAPSVEPDKKKLGVWFPILMAILLFITSLPVMAVYTVRSNTTEDGIADLIEDVPMFALVEDAFAEEDKDAFCDALGRYLHIEMTFDQVEDFMEKANINELVAEKLAAFANDLYTGESTFSLASDDVYDLLKKNNRVIAKEFGVSLDKKQMQEIAAWMIDDDAMEGISADAVKENAPGLYAGIQVGLSYVTLAIFMALSVLLIAVMFLNNVSRAAMGTGISLTVLGGLFTVFAVVAGLLPALWESIVGRDIIGFILGRVLSETAAAYVVVLLIGVLLLVGRVVVRTLIERKKTTVLA